MIDLYRQFLVEPSADRFLAALVAFELPANVAVPKLESLDQAFVEGRFESVRTLVHHTSRYFALSVHFHRLAALAAFELGEQDDAELERFIANACLEGVLSSGDGSADHPYPIAHRSDAQEVLARLRLQPIRQKSLKTDCALCDVFEVKYANAKKEIWFSVQPGASAVPPAAPGKRKRAKKVAV